MPVVTCSDELMHYGVLGMKWGVRKAERYSKRTRKLQSKAEKARAKATSRENRDANKRAGKHWSSDKLRGKAVALETRVAIRKARQDIMTSDKKATKEQADALRSAKREWERIAQLDDRARGVYDRLKNVKKMNVEEASMQAYSRQLVRKDVANLALGLGVVGAIYGRPLIDKAVRNAAYYGMKGYQGAKRTFNQWAQDYYDSHPVYETPTGPYFRRERSLPAASRR